MSERRRTPAAAPRGVLGLLREPRWVRGLVLAVAVAVVCVVLGQWQWHRRQERLARNAPLLQNYDAPARPLTDVLAGQEPLAAGDAWTRVQVQGTYDAAGTVLVRNRPRDDTTGYDVLVPLRLPDGSVLVVDRGWVPAGSSSERPDVVPAPPSGPVLVTAHLRPFEQARRARVPQGQVASIARAEVAAAAGGVDVLGAYAELAEESPAPTSAPDPAVEPTVDEGPHLAYTVQWYGFAVTALVVWVVAGRRELENRRTAVVVGAPDEAPGTSPARGTGEAPADAPGAGGVTRVSPRPARAAAPRRRRREGADEAAEDAEVDDAVEGGRGGVRVPGGR